MPSSAHFNPKLMTAAKQLDLFGNWVLVQRDPPMTTTRGGVVLPSSVQLNEGRQFEAIVVKCLETWTDSWGKEHPTPFKGRDRVVVVNAYDSIRIDLDSLELELVQVENVAARVNELTPRDRKRVEAGEAA